MAKAVAVLEVQWGPWRRPAPYFKINPHNFTGRRLYWFLGHDDLLVTNACPEIVDTPNGRGKPDAAYLYKNLCALAPFNVLIVCGRVAQATWEQIHESVGTTSFRTVYIPHPAARAAWNRNRLDEAQKAIQAAYRGEGPWHVDA